MTMFSPISAFMRPGVTVPLEATVREALETMERAGASSVVVIGRERRVPLGIFTLRDLVRRVTLPGGDLQQPIAGVMTGGLVTLRPHATAHQAALTMARNGVRHVVVVDGDGQLAGVVGQDELFGVQRMDVKQVSDDIEGARDVERLKHAALGIRRLTASLLAHGVGVETLVQSISTLNDVLTIRIIELTADEFDLPPVALCWIALGSEGRLEQTFSTDQDNALVFEADERDADHVREALLPFARAVNERLDACGFPLCKGGIMASNARWCLSLEAWRRMFLEWIDVPDPDALLGATIFFDLRPVYGSAALAERLRETLLAGTADRPVFLRHMATLALRCRPPLGWIRDFAYDRSAAEFPHTIDLKLSGSRLFVDAARVLSLAHGIPHTSTAERLRALEDALHLGPEPLAALVEAFHFLHLVRLRSQCSPRGAGAGTNRVDPADLNELDRHILKEAFRQARKLQAVLARSYDLA
jgi:CBS domain-containing protein